MDIKYILQCEPFKESGNRTYADKARNLGLEDAANMILYTNCSNCNLRDWVRKGTEGLGTLSEVETGVKYVISDAMAKHKTTMEKIRFL